MHSVPLVLLLLALAASSNVCFAGSNREQARFYLPEAMRYKKLKPVLQQLEALGVSQFHPADDKASWEKLLTDSAEFDLVWSTATTPPLSQLVLPNQFHAKVNHIPGADQLTSPDALYRHVGAQQKKHVKFFFNFVPDHYELPRDQAQLDKAYIDARKKSDFSPKRVRDPLVYRRFLISERFADIEDETAHRAELFVSDEDLKLKLHSTAYKGRSVVVDRYVEPLLLDNHKFRVGFYVVVTSMDPLRLYVYDRPLIRIAKGEYPSTLKVDTDPSTYNFDQYIAPWDFPDLTASFQELPSSTREGTNAWHVVKKYLQRQGIDTKHLQDEVEATIAKLVLSSRGYFQSELAKVKRSAARDGEKYPPTDLSDSFFDLWMFDFEFDDLAKPWLVRVVSNPSMESTQSVLATDMAVKKRILSDLINLVGVYPQNHHLFEKFYHPSVDSKFCSKNCHDTNRVWDTTCWSCPGWFSPSVASKLFTASAEYNRRGNFNLIFPSLEHDFSKFLDTELTEHDVAFDRYLKSFSSGFLDSTQVSASNRAVLCVYREHCSNHGDCVNGLCLCDSNYEGQTCYIPKDFDSLRPQNETKNVTDQEAETWMEKVENIMWNQADATKGSKWSMTGIEDDSAFGIILLILLLCALILLICRVFVAYRSDGESQDGKAK
ncbi:putative tubulin-tyrosine ligase/Tubulin polyglutamylase, ATP-grasp, subdomain 1 [Plasmopara halstedii]